uniref:Reverse transcriptase domain-containing protein n=1 Tax=Cyprinus carpio TaxID=7962 RepID=A0A8C1S4M0_CYPCA
MLPLGAIINKHNLSFHCYADDLQIYLPLKSNDSVTLNSLQNCINRIKLWLSRNFVTLNEDKTECIVFNTRCMSVNSNLSLGALTPYAKQTVRNLGVTFDCGMNFDTQISNVVKISFFQLRLLSKVKPFLTRHDLEKALHAFISSRLDYCNALYVGLSQTSLSRLQLVQNAAARFLTSTPRRAHITPVLATLHWLPVRFRIDFKILLFVFKALNGLAPEYLSELLTLGGKNRRLPSSDQRTLQVPKSKHKQWGDRAFAVAGPKLWNKLPPDMRTETDVVLFQAKLKTYLFKLPFDTQ